jgi:glycosyltransferase involved in cell wall biosynthesis
MMSVGEMAERSLADRSGGHAVEKLREVVVVISGVEMYGIRNVLVTQWRHARHGGFRFSYLAAEDGECARALRAAGATVEVGGGRLALGHPGHPLLLPLFWLARLRDIYRAYAGIRRFLQEMPCEILYTHSSYSLAVSWLAARGLDRRLVCHLHHNLNTRRLAGLQRILVSLALAALADRLVAISDFVATSLWGPARRKVCRIDNGIDVRSIMTQVRGVAKDPRRIVLVGRLVAWKKQQVAIRALRLLHERGLDCQLELIGGPAIQAAPHYRDLCELVGTLGLGEHVRFAGVITPPYRRVAAAAICVSCSTREPFGLVVIEAAACGTAVVAADAGAMPELIEHRRTGLLFRPDDPTSLADALECLLRDSALRISLAEAARRQVVERYAIEGHLHTLRRCFDAVLVRS